MHMLSAEHHYCQRASHDADVLSWQAGLLKSVPTRKPSWTALEYGCKMVGSSLYMHTTAHLLVLAVQLSN